MPWARWFTTPMCMIRPRLWSPAEAGRRRPRRMPQRTTGRRAMWRCQAAISRCRRTACRNFDAAVPTGAALAVLVMGVLLSALLAAFVRQQQTGRQRAEKRARGMTADLARLALVAQRTSNAVIITDPELRITWVNEGFTRLYGHTAEQALGQTPGALLGHPDSAPQALQTLREAAAAGSGCRVELVNRTRDGQPVFIDTEVQPTRDAHGQLDRLRRDRQRHQRAPPRRGPHGWADARQRGAARHDPRARHRVGGQGRRLIIDANDAFCRISGYSARRTAGQQPPHRQLGHPAASLLDRDVGRHHRGQALARPDLQPRQGRLAVLGRQHHRAVPGRRRPG